MLARLLSLIVLIYVAVCVFVWVFQARLIYFPSAEYVSTPADVGLQFEELSLTTSDGVSIAAWYIPFATPKGTILFCHGNAGNISHRLVSIHALHSLGYNVLIFDYRGYGKSTGSPNENGTYRDAEAAWLYITNTRGESAQRVILAGRSLGGAVAINLAAQLGDGGPAALVIESSFASLADVGRKHYPLLPITWLLTNKYESISVIGQVSCPKLFFHGKEDELIPIGNARRLYDAASAPKAFVETPGGHSNAGFTYSSEYTQRLADFLDEALGDKR